MSGPPSADCWSFRGRSAGRLWKQRALTITLISFAFLTTGCPASPNPTPEVGLEPDMVGRLVDIEHPTPGDDVYVLDVDGSRFELDDDALEIRGHPSLDGLVMVGSTGEGRWYVALGDPYPSDGSECFLLGTASAIDEGGAILFPFDETYGLRLAKAPEWVEPGYDLDGDRYASWLTNWCVSADGQVISVEARAAG